MDTVFPVVTRKKISRTYISRSFQMNVFIYSEQKFPLSYEQEISQVRP